MKSRIKFKFAKVSALILSLVVVTNLLAGCKKEGASDSNNLNTSKYPTGEIFYPLDTDVTLTYWMEPNANVLATVTDMGETPFAQELQKKTGVKLKYVHPAAGQASEQFNLLVASGDLPDIVSYPWYNFPGGAQKAIDDKQIYKLNDIIDNYAPNLKKYLDSNPEVDKLVKTDEGSYYVFPFIRGEDLLTVSYGPMMRKDWLDDLGLEVPKTIDDWTEVLTAFKEQKGAKAPLALRLHDINEGAFIGAFGIINNSYVENGQVKFGPIEKEYKDFLITMNQWYNEGLIDRDFASADGKKVDYNILNGESGAAIGWIGSNMGMWLNALQEQNPEYNLVGVPYPTLKEGEVPKFSQKDFLYTPANSVAISTNCEHPEIAARFLDYGYTEEGHLLYNFGIEGTSFNMVDGYPTYTDEILKNPEGLSIGQALGKYTQVFSGPFVQDRAYIEQYYTFPQQQEAINTWLNTDVEKYKLPLISIAGDEKTELSNIQNEVNTYVSEMYLKFVMGVEPIDNFDSYVETVKSMGVERMIEIQQAALERFNQR